MNEEKKYPELLKFNTSNTLKIKELFTVIDCTKDATFDTTSDERLEFTPPGVVVNDIDADIARATLTLLKTLEWSGATVDFGNDNLFQSCPVCGNAEYVTGRYGYRETGGHTDDCALTALIALYERKLNE